MDLRGTRIDAPRLVKGTLNHILDACLLSPLNSNLPGEESVMTVLQGYVRSAVIHPVSGSAGALFYDPGLGVPFELLKSSKRPSGIYFGVCE
jgi:hypothetical protein